MTTFTQIGELSLGRKSARTVYRMGLVMVAALLFATAVLHKELVVPHLPPLASAAEDVFFWGIAAVVGVAVQAVILADVSYTWHTLVHRLAGALVTFAAWKHMNATRSLYLPGVHTAWDVWLHMLKEYLPDRELFEETEQARINADLLKNAIEFAAASKFLHHPAVHVAVLIRYHVLSYWPLTLLMLPVLSSIMERAPEESKVSASSLLRSIFAWLQWLLVLICSIMHLSYASDLVIAPQLGIPTVSEDG